MYPKLTADQKAEFAKNMTQQDIFSVCFMSFLRNKDSVQTASGKSISEIIIENPDKQFHLSLNVQYNKSTKTPSINVDYVSLKEVLEDGN